MKLMTLSVPPKVVHREHRDSAPEASPLGPRRWRVPDVYRSALLLALCLSLGCLRGSSDAGDVTPKSTATSPGEAINLRGAPVQGATRRTESAFEIVDAQLAMKLGEFVLTGTMSMKALSTDDLEIVEVSDGLARKGRLSHVLDKNTMTLRFKAPDGSVEESVEEENGALHGRAEMIEFSGGQWARSLEGAPATPEIARLLKGPPIEDAMYPTSLKVGESWTESGPELRRWLGSDVLSVRGEVKNTLVAVESPGEKVAVIESVGEITATMVDGGNQEFTVTLGIQGHTRRSLDRAVDLEGASEGAVKMSGEVIEDGTSATMTVTGRYSAKIRGSLR